ncbi:hypothetical protein EZV62_008533 [Acer yangbiense]|uniref:Ycf20-like protein n=1 Tax=Acer yangbiense TaxID=1000413 RepID=A0A5C7IDY0_9ROSI|nr:hypothetical protein EZV62_008533 [Acer yangbiense]
MAISCSSSGGGSPVQGLVQEPKNKAAYSSWSEKTFLKRSINVVPCLWRAALRSTTRVLEEKFWWDNDGWLATHGKPKDSVYGNGEVCTGMLKVRSVNIEQFREADERSWRLTWSIGSSVGGVTIDPSSADSPNGGTGTRLIRAIQAFQTKLGARIKELRKDLPMKVFFFLVGFYCATAFATVIGQTGDWDILSAALAVVVVEGIGALMYKGSFPLLNKIRSLITMFNYWKAGLSLGLFLDSFKWRLMCFVQSRPPITKKCLVHRNQDLSVNLEAT